VMPSHHKGTATTSGGRSVPPSGSCFLRLRGVGKACRYDGIACAFPPAEETGNRITTDVYFYKLV